MEMRKKFTKNKSETYKKQGIVYNKKGKGKYKIWQNGETVMEQFM